MIHSHEGRARATTAIGGKRNTKRDRLVLLLGERARTASLQGAIVDDARPRRNTDNWVRVWIDDGQRVVHPDGKQIARRAITDAGQLIWMVETPGRRHAFHADRDTPAEAFMQAAEARARRKAVASRWKEIVALRREVLSGRKRIRVLLEDGHKAGLCDLGIEGFLKRFRFEGRASFPGFAFALISYFDRQPGYAMLVAHERQQAVASQPHPRAANDESGPVETLRAA